MTFLVFGSLMWAPLFNFKPGFSLMLHNGSFFFFFWKNTMEVLTLNNLVFIPKNIHTNCVIFYFPSKLDPWFAMDFFLVFLVKRFQNECWKEVNNLVIFCELKSSLKYSYTMLNSQFSTLLTFHQKKRRVGVPFDPNPNRSNQEDHVETEFDLDSEKEEFKNSMQSSIASALWDSDSARDLDLFI